ncbi:MAG: hypothetical protein D6790_14195 [Caldilineae bacterium]|nr:MAG: hypothetical protein D6790_14195 [Caldilineae bacterium]
MNAWREILARVFDGLEGQTNVSPEWLINPATRRRLKLDYLWPEIGVAVRFSGLTAKGQRRRSDWEVLEDQQRDQTRVELCRLNGVQLAVIDPTEDPVKQMEQLLKVLSRTRRITAQSEMPAKRKQQAMTTLAQVVKQAESLRSRLAKKPDQTLATLAEAWRDREAGLAAALQKASQLRQPAANGAAVAALTQLSPGQRVVHERFGQGVVTWVDGSGEEATIRVLFDGEQERTFLARLVAGKLQKA